MSLLVVALMLMGLQSMAEGTTLGQRIQGRLARDLISSVGLMDMLNHDGPFTLFLPSDHSLRQFLHYGGLTPSMVKQNPDELKDYLLYHIVNGTLSSQDFFNERLLTALNGRQIRVNTYDNGKGRQIRTVQGVPMHGRTQASNGVLYGLSSPMMFVEGEAHITAVIQLESNLSTLVNATLITGLDQFLAEQSPVTLFAPTNTAFNALGNKLDTLLANPQLLTEVLKYHVVPGTVYSEGMNMAELPTFEADDRLHLSHHFGRIGIEGAHIKSNGVDFSARNGVIHKIDRVLIPASLRDQI